MNTEFLTSESRLTVDKDWINETKIITKPKDYWFDSFIFLSLIIAFFTYEALTENSYRWILVLCGLIWISPHFKKLFQILFINTRKTNIRLAEIKDVKIEREQNEFEEKVILTLKSGRKKIYLFRKSENQAERFLSIINL